MIMKKVIIAALVIVALYEISFRICTSLWGEMDTDTRPVTLYYSEDLIIPGRPLIHLFNWRASLPLGKIKLASGAYINGGVFYGRTKDGKWHNLTEMFDNAAQQSVPGYPPQGVGSPEP